MKPTDPQPEALAAPLEPRGLSTIREALGLFRSIALCGEEVSPRAEAIMAEALKSLAQLESAQPPSAMTELGGEHTGSNSPNWHALEMKARVYLDNRAAAEPHTLTRAEVMEKARELYLKATASPHAFPNILEFAADLAMSLSLPSTRPSGDGCSVCGKPKFTPYCPVPSGIAIRDFTKYFCDCRDVPSTKSPSPPTEEKRPSQK